MTGLLVGYGSIGRRHLTNLHSLGVTDWAVVHTGKGTLPLELPCPARIYSDLPKALEKEVPSFAVIANPTSLHIRCCVGLYQRWLRSADRETDITFARGRG